MARDRRRFIGSLASAALLGALGSGTARAVVHRPVRIGYAISRSGYFAAGAQTTQEPSYLLWAEQVNAAGGLLVQGLRRKVELLGVDDRSDTETCAQAYLRLMTREAVDLVLAPWGTRATLAVAPLANRYGYPLLAPTAASRHLIDMNLPYYFSTLQQAERMMQALVGLLLAQRVRTLGIVQTDDLFGAEQRAGLDIALRGTDIEVVVERRFLTGSADLAPVLRPIAERGPDAFIGFTYPADTLLATTQAQRMGFNPRLFYLSVGTAYPSYRERFGARAQGVLGMGSWNAKTSESARSYYDAHRTRFGTEPDRWSSGHTWASLQVLQQAIATVGLDRRALRERIASATFDTLLGPTRFRRGEIESMPGTVGQWQNGEFEVVWPPERATAALLALKPAWS